MKASRDISWHATGHVEKAWNRIDPPRRDVLAERMGVAGSDLSQRNNSTDEKPKPMTLAYAKRIVEAVQQDDPTFTIADLGAPSSVVADADPTVLETLQELATKLASLTRRHTAARAEIRQLRVRVRQLEDRSWPDEAQATGS